MPNRDFNPPYKRVPAIPELKSMSLTLAPLVGGLEQYRFNVSDNALPHQQMPIIRQIYLPLDLIFTTLKIHPAPGKGGLNDNSNT